MLTQSSTLRKLAAPVLAALFSFLLLAACNTDKQHPDVKDAVDSAMTQNGLGVVKVSQDRDKGVLTLTGDVEGQDQKARAEQVAKQAAPDYAISSEIGVRPIGQESQAKSVDSDLDKGIEDNYQAALKAHKNLDDQSIHTDVKNGTLVVKGTVKTPAQKKEAVQLARAVPNVKDVVDEIQVNGNKNSTNQ